MNKFIGLFFLLLALTNCTTTVDCSSRDALKGTWVMVDKYPDDTLPVYGSQIDIDGSGQFIVANGQGNKGINHYTFLRPTERYNEYVYNVRILDSQEEEVKRGLIKLRINGGNLFRSDYVDNEYSISGQISSIRMAVSEELAPSYGIG